MPALHRVRRPLALAAFALCTALASASLWADMYDDAVAHAGRPAKDLERDALDHPAQILRLSGVGKGWKVGDYMGATGYYSELLSYLVGPRGQVYLLNNQAYDDWSENRWQGRIKDRLPNVEHRQVDFENIDLPSRSLDAVFMIKVFHDLYWVDDDPKDHWPKFNTDRAMREVNEGIQAVLGGADSIDLSPQKASIRRQQHELVRQANLFSHSYGKEPERHIRIYR